MSGTINYPIFYYTVPNKKVGFWMYKRQKKGYYTLAFNNVEGATEKDLHIIDYKTNSTNSTGTGDNEWYNYSLVYDKQEIRLFVSKDGDKIEEIIPLYGSPIVSIKDYITSGYNFAIASNHDETGNWKGCIDEFRLYNRVLSLNEIAKIINKNMLANN